MVKNRIVTLIIALAVVVFLPAVLPSAIFVNPKSATIVGDNLILDRRVTIPVHAEWDYEINMVEPPYTLLLDCTASGEAHFERRGINDPIIHEHNCEDLVAGVSYQLRWCVHVKTPFGVEMLRSCTVNIFTHKE